MKYQHIEARNHFP